MRSVLIAARDLLARGHRQSPLKTWTAVVLMLASGAMLPLAALTTGTLLDAALAGQRGTAITTGVVVAVLLMGGVTLSHFAHIAYFELAERDLVDYDVELIGLANGSSGLDVHETPEHADRLAVLEEEVPNVRMAMKALMTTASLLVAMSLTAVLLAVVHPLLLALPVVAVPALLAGKRAEQVVDDARTAAAEPSRLARSAFRLAVSASSAKELRVYRLGADVRRRHAELWDAATDVLGKAHSKATLLRAFGQLWFAIGYVGAVLLVVWEATTGRLSAGAVVLVVVLAFQVNVQVATAVALLPALRRFAFVDQRMRELRAAVSGNEHERPGGAVPPPDRLREGIRLDGVSLTYPGGAAPVLRDVDLTLAAGTTVAVVGENGAGKTSLVKLLCGFHRPTGGTITVDGVDLADIGVTAWRERIAAGFQDFVRYEFTAREAVGLGDLPRIDSHREVEEALGRAGAQDLVPRLPDGLDTRLGTSYAPGVDLSGGQWQKLALGRAFMRERPLLLVLDEPTAALDAKAEHALFSRYAAQATRYAAECGTVTVLVSHRFSTVRMADLIVVVDGGRIAEAGTHAELVARGGLYSQLYGLQARAYR
ncbi:ATP-binding cassette, subfamily B [Lentzea fradiae]|uniref:ATP-binding cassette, subfamily B n=1 Tax=Lentzea fradiae TaxID=200378 RepID=A0A1G8BEG8_9PSEU|nr:ABC transporter ATP-binding protein [Lentzea fradiae]SDH31625.1 ATP-binding cassette, subfamily B [Lentzea fradiae]